MKTILSARYKCLALVGIAILTGCQPESRSGGLRNSSPDSPGIETEKVEPIRFEIIPGDPREYSIHLQWKTTRRPTSWILRRFEKENEVEQEITLPGAWENFIQKVEPGKSYNYTLGYTLRGDFVIHAKGDVTIPTDISLSGDVNGAQLNAVGKLNRLFLDRRSVVTLHRDTFTLEIQELISDGAMLQTFLDQKVAGVDPRKSKEPAGIIHIRAKKARGQLTIMARGYPGHDGTRFNYLDDKFTFKEYVQLDGTDGGDAPAVFIDIAEESQASFDIQRIPGKGGKPLANGKHGTDGKVSPYCIRIASRSIGDCQYFSHLLKKEEK